MIQVCCKGDDAVLGEGGRLFDVMYPPTYPLTGHDYSDNERRRDWVLVKRWSVVGSRRDLQKRRGVTVNNGSMNGWMNISECTYMYYFR